MSTEFNNVIQIFVCSVNKKKIEASNLKMNISDIYDSCSYTQSFEVSEYLKKKLPENAWLRFIKAGNSIGWQFH